MEKVLIIIVIFTLAWVLVKFYMLSAKEKEEEQSRSEPFIVKSYPNGVMKTPENQEKIAKWLGIMWPKQICEVCGSKDFILADHIISSPIYSKNDHIGSYPFVLISCKKCSNTKHFSAEAMRIVRKKKNDE